MKSSFRRINMNHTDHDNQEAAAKAQEYLDASMYKDQSVDCRPVLGTACRSRPGSEGA